MTITKKTEVIGIKGPYANRVGVVLEADDGPPQHRVYQVKWYPVGDEPVLIADGVPRTHIKQASAAGKTKKANRSNLRKQNGSKSQRRGSKKKAPNAAPSGPADLTPFQVSLLLNYRVLDVNSMTLANIVPQQAQVHIGGGSGHYHDSPPPAAQGPVQQGHYHGNGDHINNEFNDPDRIAREFEELDAEIIAPE